MMLASTQRCLAQDLHDSSRGQNRTHLILDERQQRADYHCDSSTNQGSTLVDEALASTCTQASPQCKLLQEERSMPFRMWPYIIILLY